MNKDKRIIEKLLEIISGYNTDGVAKDCELIVEATGSYEVQIYRLMVKGEKDKGTPFYSGSTETMITREDFHDGELVHANVLYCEFKPKF